MTNNYTTLYRHYVEDIHEVQLKKNLDWLRIFGGREGQGGKSTNAIATALIVNKDFDPEVQMIYNLESFLNYLDVHENKPGCVGIFDEAVLQLLGSESNGYEARQFQKIFTTHRDLQQEFYLCIPSPWRLMPYIREDRVNDFVLGWMDGYTTDFDRNFAYYNRVDYASFIVSKKARNTMLVPSLFAQKYKPTLDGAFTLDTAVKNKVDAIYKKVFDLKKNAQRELRTDIRQHLADATNGEMVTQEESIKVKKASLLCPAISRLCSHPKWRGSQAEACNVIGMSPQRYIDFRKKFGE